MHASLNGMDTTNYYYPKNGSAGSQGVDFQVGLLTMFLLNALQKISNWELSTENKLAGKFDDVVLKWSEGTVLLQAKHKENKDTRITLKDFLSTKPSSFSLPMYFLSYQGIKNEFNVKNLVICTNAKVDDKMLVFLKSHRTCCKSMLYSADAELSFFKFNTDILPQLKQAVSAFLEENYQDRNINQTIMTDKNLEEFLDHLQIHGSFPAGNDLKDIIEKSLSVLKCSNQLYERISCSEIQSKVKTWFQQKRGLYLTENNAKAMFSEIKTDKYWQKLSHYNVTFKQSLNLRFINSKQIYFIIANYGYLLQEIKIYRTLKNLEANTLCVSRDDEVTVQKQIIEAFKLSPHKCLVILWPDESLFTEINEKLSATLEKSYKKIIIAIKSNNEIVQLSGLHRQDYEVIFETVTFDDLSDETQDRLLRKNNIIFQGRNINLGELFPILGVGDFEKATNLFIHKLVGEEKIKVGAELFELDETHLYISRTFKKEMETTDTTVYSEESIYKVDEKIVVIADAAGMGKTTVLTNLAAIIKQRDPRLWVIQIKLNDFSTVLKDFVKTNRRTINIMDLLNSHDATKMTNDFEKFVFAMRKKVVLMLDGVDEISPDYTHLIMDLLLQCQEASNFAKVFVTTRAYMAHELESKLQVTSFTLKPFTEENEIHFLTRYWTHYLSLTEDINKKKCEKYAKALLNKMLLTDVNRGIEDHFAAIPLQLKMLAEIFQKSKGSDEFFDWQGCKEYLHTDEKEPKLPEKMNLVKLYDMFIEKKRDIFIDKENPYGLPAATHALTHQFYESLDFHRILALESVVGERGRAFFSCYDKNTNDMKTVALKIGIVQKSKEALHFIYNDDEFGTIDHNEFNFVHRMLAEYFVAESIVRELQYPNENVEFQRFLIEEVFYTHTFNSVLIFFDNFLYKIPNIVSPIIFQSYQSISYEVRLIWRYNLDLIHRLAKKGYLEVLRLLLKCTDFTVTRNKEVFISDIYDVGVRSNIEKRNTLNCLQFFLKQGGLNIKDNLDRTPLHFAASRGHLKMVKFLVEQGANVNAKSSRCCSPIVEAAQNGHVDVTKYLLVQTLDLQNAESMRGNDYDVTTSSLENMLRNNEIDTKNTMVPYVVACMGSLSLLEGLIEQGINVNSRFENGETLIFGAARGGHLHIIQYLVEKGANINSKDNMGRTVLHLTSRKPCGIQTAKLLIKLGINIDISDDSGQTALYVATFHGILDMVELLVESDANVNSKDNFGNTILNAAVSWGSLDCVIFLVASGADVNVKDNNGNTLIHSAASRQQVTIVKYLVACNVDANIKNKCGQTAVHTAAFAADEDTVELLVKLGMDVNTTDDKGRTALYVAVEMFLNNIEHTIDVDLPTTYEDRYLRRYSVFSVFQWMLSSFKFLIDQNADVNIKDKEGRTVLHLAAEKGQLNTVEFLIENGANVNAKDNKGLTPLHLTAKEGNAATVQLLIEQDANVGSRDYKGNTPAALAKKAGHLDLHQYLKVKTVRQRCIQILSVGCT